MEYTLIRSSRRTLAIQIGQSGEIIVRAPMRYSTEKIDVFLHEKSSWIEKHTGRMREKYREQKSLEWYYHIFGVRYERWGLTETEIVQLSKDALREYISTTLPRLSHGKSLWRTIANIRINSARTRWGSCSSRGNLSFSYRLVAYPRETIDAVIIHELAHLTHANHSAKFWSLVYEWMPDYEERVRALKKSPRSEEM